MFYLELNSLCAGDIIITRSSTTLFKRIKSKAIGVATGGPFSHVALYLGNGSILEAVTQGVHSHNVLRIPFKNSDDVKVLRLKPEFFDQDAIKQSIAFVRTNHGRQYAYIDTIFSTPWFKKNDPATNNKTFCSRLVASAYNNAGLPLVDNSNYASPEDIHQSNKLEEVKNVTIFLEDSMEPEEHSTLLSDQVNIVNKLFSEFRTISGSDIQTFEQAITTLINKPHLDVEFTSAIHNSGYFDLKDQAYELAPWLKNPEDFVLKQTFSSKEELLARLNIELTNIRSCIERYNHQLSAFQELSAQYPNLSFLQVHVEFYSKIRQEYQISSYMLSLLPQSSFGIQVAQIKVDIDG